MRIAYQIFRVVTALIGLLFVVMGLQWLFAPDVISEQFAVLPNGLLGWATMRADFGGFFIVAGVTAGLSAWGVKGAGHYLICCAMLMAVAATGRTIGFVVDGMVEGGFEPFVFELFTLTMLVGLATTRRRVEAAEVNAES